MKFVEKWVTSALTGQRKRRKIESGLCWALSQGYRLGVKARNALYNQGVFRKKTLPNLFVLSVGNIAACGTGKTPLVHKIVKELSSHLPVAIVSRGFLSDTEKRGENHKVSLAAPEGAKIYGDEPFLLAKKTAAPIFVGRDRYRSGLKAYDEGIQCVVLDDGLQHRKLARQMEIVVVDAKDPLCKKRFLPFGWLRDDIGSLTRATYIVAISVENEGQYKEVCRDLQEITTAPVIGMIPHAPLPLLPSHCVGLFCGIGRPERFVKTVRDLKIEIVDTLFSADHELPACEALLQFALQCQEKGASALVCTEKDFVKLPACFSLALPIIPVGIELQVTFGKEHWEKMIQTVVDRNL